MQCQAVLQRRYKLHHAHLMKEIEGVAISKSFRLNLEVLQAREAVEGVWDDAYYRRGSACSTGTTSTAAAAGAGAAVTAAAAAPSTAAWDRKRQ
mmetsp:Transcript_17183/g.32631  ORF Transcript_17183/g.32631 Transcript_17183/m.32631 type:complete len:94 (-) Transcript_17183:945-1226(-)